MNWLIYIGGFPLFAAFLIFATIRLMGKPGFELRGQNFWIFFISSLMTWIWICKRFLIE